MTKHAARHDAYSSEIAALRARAEEADEILRAIQSGGVDAIVRSGPSGQQVFTLKGADHPYQLMIEAMGEGAVALASDGVILYCNRCFADFLGQDLERVIGARMHGFVVPEDVGKLDALLRQSGAAFVATLRRPNGSLLPAHIAMRGLGGGATRRIVVVTDLSEIAAVQEQATRTLRMINAGSQIVINAADESQLLGDMCRAAVEIGGYKLAWVGYAQDDTAKSVRPMAVGGPDADYVAQARVSWADIARGRGPTGTAIRTGEIIVARDTKADADFGPWRRAAAKCGYRSSASIPLKLNGKVFGALSVYSISANAFDQREMDLLGEFAAGLAFGVGAMRTRNARDLIEADIHRSEAELKEAQHLAQLGSWALDIRSGRVTWSDELYRMVGRDVHLAAPTLEEQEALFKPEAYLALHEALKACAERGAPYMLDLEFVRQDGATGWMLARGEAERNRDGLIARIRGTALDITEQKKTEKSLRAARASLADAQAMAHMGSWQFDLQNDRLTWSDEIYRIFGVDPAIFIPSYNSFLTCVHPEDRDVLERVYKRSLEDHSPYSLDHRIVPDGGAIRVVHEEGQTFYGDDGKPVRTIGTVQDITERKNAENALRQERDLSAALIDSLPGVFMLIDERGRLVRWNQALSILTGLSDDQLRGTDAIAIIAEAERELARAAMREAFAHGHADAEFDMPSESEELRAVHFTGRTITSEGRLYLLVVGSDRTEERKAEGRIRESEQKLHTIFSSVSDGIFLSDPGTGTFIDANQPGCDMFGYSLEEVIGRDIQLLSAGIPPYTQTEVLEWARKSQLSGPQLFEWQGKAKDGHLVWLEISLSYQEFGGRDLSLAVVRDITERKQVEQRLGDSELRLRTVLDTNVDGIVMVDAETTKFKFANWAFCELLGYRPDEVTSLAIKDIHPTESLPEIRRHFESQLRGQTKVAPNLPTKRKDGAIFFADISASPMTLDGRGYMVACFHDVSERKRAADALAYRDRILHAVTVATAELVAGESIGAGMTTALKTVGEAIGVDRVLVLQNAADVSTPPELRYSWQAPDLVAPIDQALISAGTPDAPEALGAWLAPLAEGKPVITHTRTAAAPIRRLLERLNNKSVLLVPIYMGGQMWGTIGIDDCKSEREWTATEIDLLGTFAEVIGVVILRNGTQLSLRKSEERFRAVSETALDAIIMIDTEGRIRYWNRAAERMLGYSADEALGKPIHDWLAPARYRDKALEGMREFAAHGTGAALGKTLELAAKRKDGVEISIELAVNAMMLGPDRYAVGILRDISDRKRAEEQITLLARHDSLTGLPNRRVFVEALQQAIAHANRAAQCFSVLYLDLDHFKDVNDTLGHPVGDLLLQAVAERLRSNVRETDTVAQFGGDEFSVIETDLREPADAAILADKLLKALSEPFIIAGNEIRSGTSVGIAVFAPNSPDAETLLTHADVALYRAKSEGRGTYRFFTDAMDSEVRTRVKMNTELREAISSGQLFLVYQPQIDTPTGRIIGVEALVRWRHPKRGVLLPDDFIPAAEKSGLIVPLGHFILHEACRQAAIWADAGIAPPLLAMNVSALQFKTTLDLESDIAATLAETKLPPQCLELELTESVLMAASSEHNDVLVRLHEAGIRIAIDDFGTGYSSLDYLRRMKVDRIKIAQGFIRDLSTNSGDARVVKAAISLAHELGLDVMVEGVETAEQLALVTSWGCRKVQGHYFAAPLPGPEIAALLRVGKIVPASSRTGGPDLASRAFRGGV